MHLHFKGGILPEQFDEVVAKLTDAAYLKPSEIRYDANEREVIIPMLRTPVVKTSGMLGGMERLAEPVECWFVARQVLNCEVQLTEGTDPNDTLQLIFGVKLNKKTIHASSSEESRGISLFSIDIDVEFWDVEVVDGT